MLEAGTKYLSASCSNSTCPVLPSQTSNPHAPFAGCPLPRIIRARAAKSSAGRGFCCSGCPLALPSDFAGSQHFSGLCFCAAACCVRATSEDCPAVCAQPPAAKQAASTPPTNTFLTLHTLAISPAFPLLEYSCQAKYIPYD